MLNKNQALFTLRLFLKLATDSDKISKKMHEDKHLLNSYYRGSLPHGAGAHVSGKGHGGGDVVGDDASAKTVVGVVGAIHRLVECLELENALHRAEYLE